MKVLLLLVATFAFASAGGHDKLLEAFGCKKIFESCFGTEFTKNKFHEFRQHLDACKSGNNSPASIKRTAFDWSAVFKNQKGDGPLYLPVAVPQRFMQSRVKRSQQTTPFFSSEKLNALKNTFVDKMKIAGCVLQRMNILDEDLNMQWTALRQLYNDLPSSVDQELKTDLLEVNKKCQQFIQCIPFDQQKLGTFPLGLKQAFIYFKCEKKKKIEACLKKDLRKKSNSEMFELEGLDGLLEHMQGEDDKMLKVLKIYTKFGDDDLDIFS